MREMLKRTSVGRALGRVGKETLAAANRMALQLYLARASRGKAGAAASAASVRSDLRTGLVAHIYYPELLDEVLACRACLPADAVCHFTAPPEVAETLRPRVADMPSTTLTEVENRGRDIAPFLTVLRSGALDELDAVLKIHTKRSPHLAHGSHLRRAMFTALAGRPDTVARILSVMADPSVGMVGWRRVFMTAKRHWHTNRHRVEDLAARLEPPAAVELAFFGGSMFWFRPAALRSIAALALSSSDFEPEEGQLDGTLHHALERCFSIAAVAAGYAIYDTSGRLLLDRPDAPAGRHSGSAG